MLDQKSAWLSKINWTQAVAVATAIGAYFGLDVPDSTKAEIVTAIAAVQGVVTWVLRTFFTKTTIKAV